MEAKVFSRAAATALFLQEKLNPIVLRRNWYVTHNGDAKGYDTEAEAVAAAAKLNAEGQAED